MGRGWWKTYYTDENGEEHLIEDEKKTVSFRWVERNLGISRKTLFRHRVPYTEIDPENMRGVLRVYPHATTFTRTDWVFHFITTIGGRQSTMTRNLTNTNLT